MPSHEDTMRALRRFWLVEELIRRDDTGTTVRRIIDLEDRVAELTALLQKSVDAWPEALMDDDGPGCEISGADAVEWLCGWLQDVKATLESGNA